MAHPRKLPVVVRAAPRSPASSTPPPASSTRPVLSVAYGAGLRVAEVSTLKVGDVDSEPMLLRVKRAARAGGIATPCSRRTCSRYLRQWWKVGRQQGVDAPRRLAVPGTASDEADQHAAAASHRRRGSTGRQLSPSGRQVIRALEQGGRGRRCFDVHNNAGTDGRRASRAGSYEHATTTA